MPAESKAQSVAARMALAAKHGHLKTKLRKGGAVRSMMSMSDAQLRDFVKVKKGAT
jgi:hypothetical protein